MVIYPPFIESHRYKNEAFSLSLSRPHYELWVLGQPAACCMDHGLRTGGPPILTHWPLDSACCVAHFELISHRRGFVFSKPTFGSQTFLAKFMLLVGQLTAFRISDGPCFGSWGSGSGSGRLRAGPKVPQQQLYY